MHFRRHLAPLLVLAVAVPALAAPAVASDGEVRREGRCTGRAEVKMKAKHDDGRIELQAEVDTNRNGRTWRWVIRHNGYVSFSGRAVTRAPSGSFEVERRAINVRGLDSFKFRARHRPTGQVCVVRVTL
jgi:hypothetical protein